MGDPTEKDHTITFTETRFRIPLSLWGIFSYFPTTRPTQNDLLDPTDVYMLTPSRWNPHSDVYARNEESMLDWEGNMKELKDREVRFVLHEIPDDEEMVSALHILAEEGATIDAVLTLTPVPEWEGRSSVPSIEVEEGATSDAVLIKTPIPEWGWGELSTLN